MSRSGVRLKALYGTLEDRAKVLSRMLQNVRIVGGKLIAAREIADNTRSQLDVKRTRLSTLVSKRSELYRALQPKKETPAPKTPESVTTVNALLGTLQKKAPVDKPEQTSSRVFVQLKGNLRPPVSGRISDRYGDLNDGGQPQYAITIKTRPGSEVVSPVGGEVLFAGSFRSYGTLLIVAPAEDYHVLLAGFGSLDVSTGQWLLAGEPVGRVAQSGQKKAGISGSETSVYIELRNKGQPINPTSWMRGIKGKVTE